MHTVRLHRTAALVAAVTCSLTISMAACGSHGNDPGAENTAGTSVTPAVSNAAPAPDSGTAAALTPSQAASQTATDTSATHHSKLAGAALGAVAGHVVGGTKGAIAGAVIGAEIQHHRNKAYEKAHP